LEEAKREWVDGEVQKWAEGVRLLAKVASRFPQTAYAGLVKSLQTEWTYLQRVVPDINAAFAPIEKAVVDDFLPLLFGDSSATFEQTRALMAIPVKFAGTGITDPVASAARHHAFSRDVTTAVTTSLISGERLEVAGYLDQAHRIMSRGRAARDGDLEREYSCQKDQFSDRAQR
jgi:hypothetical protein